MSEIISIISQNAVTINVEIVIITMTVTVAEIAIAIMSVDHTMTAIKIRETDIGKDRVKDSEDIDLVRKKIIIEIKMP